MRIGLAAAVAVVSLLVQAAVIAATPGKAALSWIGVWGYVSAPLPPGTAPAAPAAPAATATVPLGPSPSQSAPAPRPPLAPLLENPGNVPVEILAPELSNVTVRQLVRVSA